MPRWERCRTVSSLCSVRLRRALVIVPGCNSSFRLDLRWILKGFGRYREQCTPGETVRTFRIVRYPCRAEHRSGMSHPGRSNGRDSDHETSPQVRMINLASLPGSLRRKLDWLYR
jgi:hypothetical protein